MNPIRSAKVERYSHHQQERPPIGEPQGSACPPSGLNVNLFVANLIDPQHTGHSRTLEALPSFDTTDLLGIFVQPNCKVLDREAGSLAHLHEQEACLLYTTHLLEIGEFTHILQEILGGEILGGERVKSFQIKGLRWTPFVRQPESVLKV
jgi:hypothetical protein